MTRTLRITHALLAASLLPVAAEAQKVSYDYNRTANFAEVRSFAVKPGELSDSQLVNERIANAIAGTLAGRGLVRSSEPDVYIVPRLEKETRQEVTSWGPGWYGSYGGYGFARWYGGWDWYGPSSYTVRDVEYATLTIDMVDARTGTLLWRGKGVRSVNPHWEPDTVDRKVRKTVDKIFKNYPPGRDDD
jgi:Domain of unknown function (DUF4136)